mmetsp:Transcript_18411/g.43207  ORF Transcript_18411/g.43207 Transcript_18411/m.43207 type:complete len:278 (-) Transcript_18411:35-868(-)
MPKDHEVALLVQDTPADAKRSLLNDGHAGLLASLEALGVPTHCSATPSSCGIVDLPFEDPVAILVKREAAFVDVLLLRWARFRWTVFVCRLARLLRRCAQILIHLQLFLHHSLELLLQVRFLVRPPHGCLHYLLQLLIYAKDLAALLELSLQGRRVVSILSHRRLDRPLVRHIHLWSGRRQFLHCCIHFLLQLLLQIQLLSALLELSLQEGLHVVSILHLRKRLTQVLVGCLRVVVSKKVICLLRIARVWYGSISGSLCCLARRHSGPTCNARKGKL